MKALLTITLPDYAAFLAKVAAQAQVRRKDRPRDGGADDPPMPVEKEDGE